MPSIECKIMLSQYIILGSNFLTYRVGVLFFFVTNDQETIAIKNIICSSKICSKWNINYIYISDISTKYRHK